MLFSSASLRKEDGEKTVIQWEEDGEGIGWSGYVSGFRARRVRADGEHRASGTEGVKGAEGTEEFITSYCALATQTGFDATTCIKWHN